MLSYFAMITLVKLSGLLIPLIWFLIIADRRGRTISLTLVILLFIVSFINTYFNLPDLAYPSLIDGWLSWLIGGLILVMVLKRMFYSDKPSRESNGDGFFAQIVNRTTESFGWAGRIVLAIASAILIFIVLTGISSLVTQMNPSPSVSSIKTDLNNDASNAPMPVIKGGDDTPVVNAPQTISTDMNNSLNSFKNSNVYDLNHMRVQMYRNKMVYVAPVEFSGGFWRYIHYQQVPGYFMTNATDKNADPKFVKKPMKYTPSAYFNSDADRRISAHSLGYSMVGSTSQLEVDDKGTPYYVRTLAKPISYINRNYDYKHFKVAVLNTITGKVDVYSPNKVPKFIDISVSPDWVAKEVSMFGKYRKGFWNATSFGGHSDVMKPTKAGTEGGKTLTPYAYKGRVYYFTGMTSINSHQSSILGYTFVDARTNTLHYYKEHGNVMTPERAISYAEQDINPQNYKGTLPLLYKIGGKPTWVVSMLDRENNSFMKFVYLLADGNNQSGTYAVGDDAQSTLDLFNQRVGAKVSPATQGKSSAKTVTGNIYRIIRTNDNQTLFILKGDPQVYKIDPKDSDFNPLFSFISTGDKVTFKATSISGSNELSTAKVNLTTFKDSALKQK
ncbi:hypothetical protein [Lentilactobacillus sp. SPB1-3]|uniref:Uncharacterized protein n=1 Tax=Lentilactobacillus terminaliae TaxID=3003483 RepID=A0ACD5DF60_9LACO|nr:hypothetical protein [Lentilactobacillus sp. SPB1-3]MCZ0976371.1 hypothetical protein [Lentilactobacillus sp. SPB1-3]